MPHITRVKQKCPVSPPTKKRKKKEKKREREIGQKEKCKVEKGRIIKDLEIILSKKIR